MVLVAEKTPAQPQALSLLGSVCGAEIRAEEETRVARGGGPAQRLLMGRRALADRQAVVMRANAAHEDIGCG